MGSLGSCGNLTLIVQMVPKRQGGFRREGRIGVEDRFLVDSLGSIMAGIFSWWLRLEGQWPILGLQPSCVVVDDGGRR